MSIGKMLKKFNFKKENSKKGSNDRKQIVRLTGNYMFSGIWNEDEKDELSEGIRKLYGYKKLNDDHRYIIVGNLVMEVKETKIGLHKFIKSKR